MLVGPGESGDVSDHLRSCNSCYFFQFRNRMLELRILIDDTENEEENFYF